MVNGYDWETAARAIGITRDGRFNAGTMRVAHPRALVWFSADGAEHVLSGADVEAYARRLAAALATAGVTRGDRVAGVLGRRPESLVLPMALWQLGAIYVPLFSGFQAEAIRTRVEDSGTTFILTDAGNRDSVAEAQERLGYDVTVIAVQGDLRDGDIALSRLLEDSGPDVAVADTSAEDPATIMYTSGTSGKPKGCVIPHRALVTLWPFMEWGLGLSPDDVLFSTADTGWSFGLFTTGMGPLSYGGSRILYEAGYDAEAWWRLVRDKQVTHLASAPTGFRQLSLAPADVIGDIRHLKHATSAGEPLNGEIMRWWQDEVGVTIHDTFGLTEVGMVVGNVRREGEPAPLPKCAGVPVPGFDVRLVDEDGAASAPGEQGRIAVRDHGYLFTSTYWGREDEWDARIVDGWWVTEDIARQDEEGRYWYIGRGDDVIVTAGYNVGPSEVEAILLKHPAVVDVACVAEPDERKGQVVAAHLVLKGEAPPELLDELRKQVGGELGWHAAPRRLYEHDALPRTESGKVQRKLLRTAPTGG